MAGLNQRRRKAAAAKRADNAVRNSQHPSVRSPKGLSVSPAHVDSLKGASHTPGFTGLGRSVGRETTVLSRKGNLAKSHTLMADAPTVMYGKVQEPRVLGYTAPKSARFACREPREWYTNNEPLRRENDVRSGVRKLVKGTPKRL